MKRNVKTVELSNATIRHYDTVKELGQLTTLPTFKAHSTQNKHASGYRRAVKGTADLNH